MRLSEMGLGRLVRREVYYQGHVQGVGFRFTTRAIASGFDVTGTVRNLADGRVELVAEGDPAELDRFLEAIQQRMDQYIRSVKVANLTPTGEFAGFEIRIS